MNIKPVSHFPQITRSGRTSAELQSIINSLIESSKSGSPFMIEEVEEGKKFNSLQQRIRAQAKKLDLKVTIHFDKSERKLYYRVPAEESKEENVTKPITAKDVKSVKSSNKTSA